MANRIRLGIVGAGTSRGWARLAHLPALAHLPEYELTAVCTASPETARLSAQANGARLAFHDYRDLVAHPDIDAVVVSIKAPSHRDVTLAALQARKPVYTEWPLGRDLAETEEMTALAASVGVPAMVGLQGRVAPASLYMRDLVREGYVGKVLSCCMYRITERLVDEANAWSFERAQGAHAVTIDAGHTLDTLASIVGEFSALSADVGVQRTRIRTSDTCKEMDNTAPDHVLVQGVLESGALASVYIAALPGPASGGRLEIYGTEGTLRATSPESLHRGVVTVSGARAGEPLTVLPVPEKYRWVPAEVPEAAPVNVAQLYRLFARAIQGEAPAYPDFGDAARRYRILEAVVAAAESGRRIKLPT